MGKPASNKLIIAVHALFILALHVCPSPAAESGYYPPHASRLSPGKMVRLQIHISEAKRRKDMLRYYKSIARGQKAGLADLPAAHTRNRTSESQQR